MSLKSISGITEGTKLDVNGNLGHEILDSLSYQQTKVYLTERHHRRPARHKPYDTVDDLGFHKLSIGVTPSKYNRSGVGAPPLLSVSHRECHKNSRTKPLVHAAKLKLSAQVSSCVNTNFQSAKDSFDFASLAAQVSGIEQHESQSTDTTSLGGCKAKGSAISYNTKQYSMLRTSGSLVTEVENDDYQDELSSLPKLSLSCTESNTGTRLVRSCSQEAMLNETDFSAEELAYYFEELVHIPKKMSEMAEMMYT